MGPCARTATAGILCAVLAFATTAHADGSARETARALFNEGLALRARGDLALAITKLRAAHALRATPVTAYELARAYADHRDLVEARDLLLSIRRMPIAAGGESPDAQAARRGAVTLAESLKPRIPSLTVILTGPGAATKPTLSIDGVEVPAEAAAEPQRLNPTLHHVVARARDAGAAKEASVDVTLREGENARVVLDLAASANASAAGGASATTAPVDGTLAPPASAALPTVLAYGGFSLAFVGVTVGTIAGVRALDQVSALHGSCTSSKICTPERGDAISGARTVGNVSTLSFVAAGVGAGLGIVGLLLWPRSSARTTASASVMIVGTSIAVHGVFR